MVFITNIFKLNGRKYVELYLPYNKDNNGNIITINEEKINSEDLQNKDLFPPDKIKDNHYSFIKYDTFLLKFAKTFILEYSKNIFYINKSIKISDGNINFLKFRVFEKVTLCKL